VGKAMGESDGDVVYSTVRTSDGGYAMAGYTESYGEGGRDVLVIKVDSCYDTLWTRSLGGGYDEEGRCIIETSDEGLVIAGYTKSVSGQFSKLLLSKFNSGGTHQWTKALWRDSAVGVSRLNFDAYSVIEDSDSNLMVTGYMHRADLSRNSLFLAKFNSSGAYQSLRTVYNSIDANRHHYGLSLVEMCADGGYLVVGYLDDPDNDEDVLLAKFDSNGDLDYGKYMEGGDDDRANYIIRTDDCGFAIAGVSDDSLVLFTCTNTLTFPWKRMLTRNKTSGYGLMEIDGDSDLVVGGSYLSGTGTDMLLTRWTKDGSHVWSKKFGGSDSEIAYAVTEDPEEDIVAYGFSGSYGAGGDDVFLARCSSSGTACLLTSGFINYKQWNPTTGNIPALMDWTPFDLDTAEWTDVTVASQNLELEMVCKDYICGDANGDGTANTSDAVYIINYVFSGGPPPDVMAAADVNCDCTVNVSDAIWMINYVFSNGNAPCDTYPASPNGDDIEDC
jgi:hypothetical protein